MIRIFAPLALAILLSVPGLSQTAEIAPRTLGDFSFVSETPCLEVLSQGRTGTCWSFATVSYFEAEILRAQGKRVDLSEMWPVRQAYLEKTRRYLKAKGKNTFGEGGLSHDINFVIEHYGLLPASAYTGLLPKQRRHDHSEMSRVLKGVADSLLKGRRASKNWKRAVLGITDAYMGTPPSHVVVDGKTLTPVEYTRDVLGLEASNFVEVMSMGTSEFNKKAKLDVPDNWIHYDGYLNLPVDDFVRGMRNALLKGYSIAVDADVSEPGFDPRKKGTATLPAEQEKAGAVTQELRDEMFKTKKTTDDHLMHIVGLAKDKDGGYWYYTKNSWGKMGPYQGHVFISEAYMRAKALAYMVHKDALPKNSR